VSDFTTSHYPRAKVPHRCAECRRGITPGERYCRVAGKDDRIWSVALCLRCDMLNEAAWEHARGGDSEGPAFGDIVPWLLDALDMPDVLALLSPEAAGHFCGLVFAMREKAAETSARRRRVDILERP